MNQNVKTRWLKALRSGDYVQGLGKLHAVDGDGVHEFCCLGVLCEVAVNRGAIETPIYLGPEYQYDGTSTALTPESVEDWAGLDSFTPFPGIENPNPDDDDAPSLIVLNDNGYSFAQIADVIEEYL